MKDLNDVLEEIKKEQVSKAMRIFMEKFEVGTGDDDDTVMSRKLTAHGCYQRHNISRAEMYLTDKENRMRNWELPNRVERDERRTVNSVAVLLKHGYKLLPTETLEEFVTRCREFMVRSNAMIVI